MRIILKCVLLNCTTALHLFCNTTQKVPKSALLREPHVISVRLEKLCLMQYSYRSKSYTEKQAQIRSKHSNSLDTLGPWTQSLASENKNTKP